MSQAAEIGIRLRLDGGQAVAGDLSRVEQSLGSLTGAVQRLGHYGAALVALPLALNNTVGAFVRAGDAVTVLNNQLKLATGSMASAQQAYGALFDIAQRSRVSFTELGGTFASISRATSELGIGQNRLLTVTEAIGNAMAISGGNAQGMQAALTQLGQGFASGTLRGEELNSVMEQTPRLAKAIADGLGVTIGKLREMGQEGKLTSEAVLGALESQAKVLAGEVKDSVVTVAQAMTQLGNAAVALAGQIDKSAGATQKLSGLAQAAANDLGRLSDAMTRAEKSGAGFVDQMGAAAGVAVGRSAFDVINASASGLNKTINSLTGGMAGLNENVRVMPLALQSTAEQVGTLERSLDSARAQWEQLRAQGEREGKNIYLRSAMGDLEAYIARTEVALQNVRRLQGFSGDPGAGRGSVNPQTVGARMQEEAAAQDKLNELRAKALGVNTGLTDSLVALSKAQQLGLISQAEQIKLAQGLVAQTYKTTKAAKDHDAALEASRDIAKAWADTIRDGQKILADAEADTLGLTKAQQLLIQYLQSPAYLQASEAMRQVALQTLYAAHNSEVATASDKARAKSLDELDASAKKYLQTLGDQANAAEREAQSLRDQVVELNYGKAAREALVQQRLDDAAAQAQQIANASLWLEGSTAETQALQRLADRLRDVAEARRALTGAEAAKESRDASAKAALDAQADWDRTADSIRSGLTDAFRRAFESGEDFGTAMARVIERELKARIATALSGMLADGVMSVLGLQAAGSAAGSARGNTNWMQLAQTGQTLYRYGANAYNWATSGGSAAMYSTGAASTVGVTGAQGAYLGEGVTSGVAAWDAAAAGSTSASTGAAGASSGSWGAAAGYAALIAAAIVASDKAYDRGFTGSDQLSGKLWYEASIENATRSVLSKLGVSDKWAEILSGSVALNDSFGYSQARVEAAGVQGTLGAGDFTGQSFADIKSKAGWVRKLFGSDDRTSTEFAALPAELGNFLDAAAKSVFDQAKEFGEALGLPAEALSGITTDIKVTLTDDIEANKAAIAKELGTYGDALVGAWADAVKPLAAYGETTAQTIQRVGGALLGVNSVLDALGIAALAASIDGGKAALALEGMFGGIAGLQQAAGSYLQAYYTDAERAALTTAALGKEFAKVGLTLPATREGFRDLVEAQDLTTESGRAAFTALMSAAGAFDQVQQSAEAMTQELSSAIEQALPKFQRDDPYGTIQSKLAGVGVSLSIEQLMGASKDDIYAFAESFLSLSTSTHEAKMAVVAAASALADLRDIAEETATDITRAAEDMARNIWQGLSAAIADFVPARELATFRAGEVQNTLLGGGITTSVEAILGSTREDIVALWKAVGNEGKAAILEAYGAWQSMREAILEADIADIVGPLGTTADELLEAYAELTPATDNLVTSWRNTKAEVESLGDALAEIDGTAAVSAIDALRGLISQRDGLAGVISNNEDQIFNLRVGQGGQSAIDLLRQREASLWTQFASTNSPEIARAITETTLQRIALESELQGDANAAQIDALKEQISAAERLRDLAAQMGTFILGLQAGSLSNIGYAGRLAASEQLFSNSLTTGMNVQGNAQSYLQLAQGIYGGATGAYSDIFESVTGRLRGIMGVDYEGQISDAQAQLQELEGINAAANAQIAALTELNGKFGVGLGSLNTQIATQTQAVRDQIVELKTLQTNQERQILQFGEALDKLITAGGRTADAVEELVDAGGMAGAEP